HRSIGDAVHVAGDAGDRTMRVVGTAVFPGLGQGSFTPTDLGDGAAVAASLLQPSYLPKGGFYTFVLIRYRPGRDPMSITARIAPVLRRAWCPPDQACTVGGAEPPTDVSSLARVRSTPLILAGVLGLFAIAMMTHALVSSIRRRRRDMAILKTLGFRRGQFRAAVAWQATTLAAGSLV